MKIVLYEEELLGEWMQTICANNYMRETKEPAPPQ
jgi:hypothetical protein